MDQKAVSLSAAKAAALGAAMLLSGAMFADAPVPVAVWDGDFTAEVEGYTLNLNGNGLSQDGSTITITQASKGVDINFGSAFANGMTVMARYSGLVAGEKDRMIVTTCVAQNGNDRTGINIKSTGGGNSGKLQGCYYTSVWYDFNPIANTIGESGKLALTYKGDTGTYLYQTSLDGTFSTTSTWGASGLKFGADTSLWGATLGGMRTVNSNWSAASGMEIYAIAVFDKILTNAEMNDYIFPGEIATADIEGLAVSVSQLNSTYAGKKMLNLTFTDGAVLTLDAAFTASKVNLFSSGDLTLAADTQPAESELSKIDASGVEGNLARTWLSAGGGVGFNFNAASGSETNVALVAGSTWYSDASSATGTRNDLFSDGLTVLTWSCANVYNDGGSSSMVDGYLDDGSGGPTITVTNVPYESYDLIIYCSTDSSNYRFKSKTVNGKNYVPDPVSGGSAEVSSSSLFWGTTALKGTGKAVYGVNAMRVNGLSGTLTISGGTNSDSARGCISAIQIVPAGTPDTVNAYYLDIESGTVNWSTGDWRDGVGNSVGGLVTSVNACINVSGNATLVLDSTVSMGNVAFNVQENSTLTVRAGAGDVTFVADLVSMKGGTVKQGSAKVFGATPVIAAGAGGTFDLGGFGVNDSSYLTIGGSGSGDSPYVLTSTGSVTDGDKRVKNLSLFGDAVFNTDYDVNIGASGVGNYMYLNGFTLVKEGTGELEFYNVNMPGTGTLDISEGSVRTREWNNFNNSTGSTKLILRPAAGFVQKTDRVIYVDSFEWEEGGTLDTSSNGIGVKSRFTGCGETAKFFFSNDSEAELTGDLDVLTQFGVGNSLSLVKAEEARTDQDGFVTVSLPESVSGTGSISVGANIHMNFGKARPSGTIDFDDDTRISIAQKTDADIPQLKTTFVPEKENVWLYDANGAEIYDYEISLNETSGIISFFPISIPVWKGTVSAAFDSLSNWANSKIPAAGQPVVIDARREVAITVSGNYNISDLYILGGSTVSFKGSGSIILPPASSGSSHVIVNSGAVLVRTPETVIDTDGISVSSGGLLVIDAGDGTFTETAVISGDGSVQTYGTVTIGASNTFTGGLTVVSGITSTTSSTGYGPNRYGQAIANLARIVVMDGGCLDLNGTKDTCYAITISGKGVLGEDGDYSGAVINSGSEIGSNNRQTASLTLAADAMVKAKEATNGWGLVNSGHAATVLALNGHTLTVSGKGNFPIINANTASGTTTTGTLILDGVTLGLVSQASNFTGVNIIFKGCGAINASVAPTAIGSLTVKPSKTGTTATAWNLPSGLVPAVDTSNIDPDTVEVGEVLDIFTAPSELAEDTISVEAGGRNTSAITGTKVQITVKELANYLHFDFDSLSGNLNSAKADDSNSQLASIGGSSDLNPVFSRNGKAMNFHDGYTPWWGSYASTSESAIPSSPIHAGEMTATAVIKLRESGNSIVWGFGNNASSGMAVIAKDDETIALAKWVSGGSVEEIATVTGIENLLGRYHFVAVIASAEGTELRVDRLSSKTEALLPSFDGRGQLGSIHGGRKGYNAIGSSGFAFDDWLVYDARLTDGELAALKKSLVPDPFVIYIK